jgi:hypothetical protein
MSDNTLNKALQIMACDTGPGGDNCAHAVGLTASTCSTGRARSTAIQQAIQI